MAFLSDTDAGHLILIVTLFFLALAWAYSDRSGDADV